MYNHTEPNRVKTKATKKGMKTHTMPNLVKKKTTAPKKKKKPMGMRKTNVSY